MPRVTMFVVVGSAMMVGGCMASGAPSGDMGPPVATAARASAPLVDASGATKGMATVAETPDGLRLIVEASGLASGPHGLHIHSIGRCDPPDFTSAGPHWNPTGKMHGRDAPNGPHMGDFPNLIVGTDGSGRLEAVLPGARLASGSTPLLDADGAAIVIHAAADDYKTDPSGNSGARVACGVFAKG